MTELLDTPQSPEAIAQSLYLALWLLREHAISPFAPAHDRVALDEMARSEVARILALPPEQMPAPVRLALFGAKAQSGESLQDRNDAQAATLRRIAKLADPNMPTGPSESLAGIENDVASLARKADERDRLLAGINAADTAIALRRLGVLVAAGETLRQIDGILSVFPVPEGEWVGEPMVLRRARAAVAAKVQNEGEAASERLRAGDALQKIARAVHLDAGPAGEIADAAVARIAALEHDAGVQARRIRELEAEVHNLKARLAEQQDEVVVAGRMIDEVRAALGTPEAVDVVSHARSIRDELEQSRAQDADLETLAAALVLPEGSPVKAMLERVEQWVRKIGWFQELWGRVVGEKPPVGAKIFGARYRIVDPLALRIAAEGRGLPVATFDKPREVDEPGFWTAWLNELGAEFKRLDGLRQGADGAYRFASRVIDDATALLTDVGVQPVESDPPPLGAEAPLVDLARGAAQLQKLRAERALLWKWAGATEDQSADEVWETIKSAFGREADALRRALDDTAAKAGERISGLEVKLESVTRDAANAVEHNGRLWKVLAGVASALGLPDPKDHFDPNTGDFQVRPDLAAAARGLKARIDQAESNAANVEFLKAAAQAAGVPWHDLKDWCVNAHRINERWRLSLQRLAAHLGVEDTSGSPEDLEDRCKGAVRANSLQRGNGMTV
jgi:hypothetical protein